MRSNPGTPTLNTMERPLSTDTKSAIGGTRMSEAATPAVAAGNRVSTTRIVGGAGVALAAAAGGASAGGGRGAGPRVPRTRIRGGPGVALAASVVVQNAVFFLGTGAPTFGDPLGEVLA